MFIDMGIDYLFYPEKVAAREVINLLGHTSTTEYVDFSSGKLSLVVFRLEPASPLVGRQIEGFDDDETPLSYRTVAITRSGETIIPRQGEIFTEDDVIYVIARQDAVKQVMEFSGQSNIEIKNMMILGGSRIGIRIATELQEEVNIKLVDYNAEKAYRLAELLDKTLIINEDGRNTEAMMEEGLSNMDAFVAVTGRSETNILAAMLAKRMGVKKVIAEVENLNYINLAESIGIDTIINKKLVTASNIFRFTMSTDVQAIKCLTGSDAEVLEFIVKPNAPAVKTRIKDLGLPEDTIIGGIVRGDKVFIAVDNMEINPYDRVVVFAMPASVGKVGYFFLTDGACRAARRTPPGSARRRKRNRTDTCHSEAYYSKHGFRSASGPSTVSGAGRPRRRNASSGSCCAADGGPNSAGVTTWGMSARSNSSRRWSKRSITRRSSPISRRCWPARRTSLRRAA